MELTPHTITLPTPEQRAVVAACEERYPAVVSHGWNGRSTQLQLTVTDTDGESTVLRVAVDGTTREHYFGGVPTRLYGGLSKREADREHWGSGLPKHATKHLVDAH